MQLRNHCSTTTLLTALLPLTLFVVASRELEAAHRPNVILFIADDVSWNDYGCYGNKAARTPNIDRLAAGGLRFDQAFLTTSSCSPSRSSIITGRYPHNNGKASELHQPIAAHLPWFPRLLREAGYYTALVGKHHMTSDQPEAGQVPQDKPFDFVDPGRGPGNRGGHATWVQTLQQRPKDKPFFAWLASYDAHRDWDADKEWDAERYGPMHDHLDVVVPPFLADELETRQDLASYYNEVTRFDHYVGEVVAELKRQNELDNTLLFVLADNGRPFPRAKTRLHDSGMKTGLVAHWPDGIRQPGRASRSLVSVIDLAPTILKLAGVEAPATMQGVSLLPQFEDPSQPVREFVFSEHNWHDYEAHGRAVRSGDWLLIRNFRPQLAWQGPADSVRSDSHRQLQALRDAGKLSPAQADVFLAPRPEVELYRVTSDPNQLSNLAGQPEFAAIEQKLTATLNTWMDETGDSVPDEISRDFFDRETGGNLKLKSYRRTPPGADRNAPHINRSGPQ